MKAVTYDNYGGPDALTLTEVPAPALSDGKVLVRVLAAGVNPYDWHYLRGRPFILRLTSGVFRPKRKILGVDFAGIVEAVGKEVSRFKPGDPVFGLTPGTFADHVAARETQIALKPDHLSFAEAAGAPASAYTALQCLRDHGKIEKGHHVLVNGASGGVGTFAVQIARSFGAKVTGVCGTRNRTLVQSLGAEHVIDYTEEDFTGGPTRYDLVLDVVGNHSIAKFRRLLRPGGTYVAAAGPWTRLLWLRLAGGRNSVSMIGAPNPEDLETIRGLMDASTIRTVIDRSYPLSETPAAIAYVETGRARGKVIVAVASDVDGTTGIPHP